MFRTLQKKGTDSECLCGEHFFEILSQTTCIECSDFCSTCENKENCLTCDENHIRELKGKKCKCLDGYFELEFQEICQPCHSTCEKCKTAKNFCTACKKEQGRKLVKNRCNCASGSISQNLNCEKCDEVCEKCFGPADDECLSCFA